MTTILLLEPNAAAGRRMQAELTEAGYACLLVSGADHVAELTELHQLDLAIVNSSLPWKKTAPLLHQLRWIGCRLLVLTQNENNIGHMRRLCSRQDDVLLSPCKEGELSAHVHRLLDNDPYLLHCGAYKLDCRAQCLLVYRREIPLTAQECSLMQALMTCPNTPISREELLSTAWGYQSAGMSRTVDVHVQRLRKKLGNQAIETVYRKGYCLRA